MLPLAESEKALRNQRKALHELRVLYGSMEEGKGCLKEARRLLSHAGTKDALGASRGLDLGATAVWERQRRAFLEDVAGGPSWRTAVFLKAGVVVPLPALLRAAPSAPWVRWVERGWVDLGATDGQGNTALHVAADQGGLRNVRDLLSLGMSPNIPNQEGETAVHAFFSSPAIDLVKSKGLLGAFLAAGADFNRPDLRGETPYHRALSRLYGQPWYGLPPTAFDLTLRPPSGRTVIGTLIENTKDVFQLLLSVAELLEAGAPAEAQDSLEMDDVARAVVSLRWASPVIDLASGVAQKVRARCRENHLESRLPEGAAPPPARIRL